MSENERKQSDSWKVLRKLPQFAGFEYTGEFRAVEPGEKFAAQAGSSNGKITFETPARVATGVRGFEGERWILRSVEVAGVSVSAPVPTIRACDGTVFELRDAAIVSADGKFQAARSEMAGAIHKGGGWRLKGRENGLWKDWAVYVHSGMVEVGCMAFAAGEAGKLKEWAGGEAERKAPVVQVATPVTPTLHPVALLYAHLAPAGQMFRGLGKIGPVKRGEWFVWAGGVPESFKNGQAESAICDTDNGNKEKCMPVGVEVPGGWRLSGEWRQMHEGESYLLFAGETGNVSTASARDAGDERVKRWIVVPELARPLAPLAGWELTGEYRVPEAGESYVSLKGRAYTHKPEYGTGLPQTPRWILRPVASKWVKMNEVKVSGSINYDGAVGYPIPSAEREHSVREAPNTAFLPFPRTTTSLSNWLAKGGDVQEGCLTGIGEHGPLTHVAAFRESGGITKTRMRNRVFQVCERHAEGYKENETFVVVKRAETVTDALGSTWYVSTGGMGCKNSNFESEAAAADGRKATEELKARNVAASQTDECAECGRGRTAHESQGPAGRQWLPIGHKFRQYGAEPDAADGIAALQIPKETPLDKHKRWLREENLKLAGVEGELAATQAKVSRLETENGFLTGNLKLSRESEITAREKAERHAKAWREALDYRMAELNAANRTVETLRANVAKEREDSETWQRACTAEKQKLLACELLVKNMRDANRQLCENVTAEKLARYAVESALSNAQGQVATLQNSVRTWQGSCAAMEWSRMSLEVAKVRTERELAGEKRARITAEVSLDTWKNSHAVMEQRYNAAQANAIRLQRELNELRGMIRELPL